MEKTIKTAIKESKTLDSRFHFFNNLIENPNTDDAINNPDGALNKTFISVKDCICVKDMESTAGSMVLDGYMPVFDATVIKKVKQEGGIILGKTSQDAFGFGSFNINVGKNKKIPLNPLDIERVCGGSSGGAAGLTRAAGFPHLAIAESTGGSIVAPASYCGVIGICPTYGRVSRYGLMDYANSLDKIGVMAKKVKDAALLLKIISGYDELDSTSLDAPVPDYPKFAEKTCKNMKIGIIKESLDIDQNIKKPIEKTILKLKKEGINCETVSMPLTFRYGIQTYYLISMSEASTNLAKYCGLRYGYAENFRHEFNKHFSMIRSKTFNKESKRRIMIGTFARMSGFRDAYYIKAMKVRTLIIKEYKDLFAKYDLLLSPTMPNVAPKFSEIDKLSPLENYMMDIMTVGPNLAGFPHISIPCGTKDNMPIGIMGIADHLSEQKLIQFGSMIERISDEI